VGLVAQYLTEPPPDLSPGLAGTLVDETADIRDIVATIVDLARRSVLKISERLHGGGLLTTHDWYIEPGERYGQVSLQPYEQALITALGIAQGGRALSDFRYRFYTHIPKIQSAFYEALVAAGYYTRSPDQTRQTYRTFANLVIVSAVIVFLLVVLLVSNLTELSICLPTSLFATGLLLGAVARHMPLRTRKGTEMRMRAEAFKRYLSNIEKYTQLQESKDLFDRYLPYAIAFGLDHSWVSKFAAIGTPPPPWYTPMRPQRPISAEPPTYTRPSTHAAPSTTGSASVPRAPRGDISGQARADGGIEGLERDLGQGVTLLERNLSMMFDSAAAILTSQPPSDDGWRSSRRFGSGWSGGGSFGGGGSGGGRGGFG
jgi:uncharacterized membrane protein YgcG